MFPVNSTSVETDATRRLLRVLGRAKVSRRIAFSEVYNCKKVAGTDVWSDHSWGAAADLFPKPPAQDDAEDRAAIVRATIRNATKRTLANRCRKLRVRYVIDHDALKIYEAPDFEPKQYSGLAGDHVHVSTGKKPEGVPPCAR